MHVESNEVRMITDLFCEEFAFTDFAMLLKHKKDRLLWKVFLVFLSKLKELVEAFCLIR